jgi:hypothetical protein
MHPETPLHHSSREGGGATSTANRGCTSLRACERSATAPPGDPRIVAPRPPRVLAHSVEEPTILRVTKQKSYADLARRILDLIGELGAALSDDQRKVWLRLAVRMP